MRRAEARRGSGRARKGQRLEKVRVEVFDVGRTSRSMRMRRACRSRSRHGLRRKVRSTSWVAVQWRLALLHMSIIPRIDALAN